MSGREELREEEEEFEHVEGIDGGEKYAVFVGSGKLAWRVFKFELSGGQ